MIHSIRWTLPKIEQRLKLIEPLVYRRQVALPAFRVRALVGEEAMQAIGPTVDESGWEVIEPLSYWGHAATSYVLRSRFQVPADWREDASCALFLSLGKPGDFSHPEALLYIDGASYAATDRHHPEVRLNDEWRDGAEHTLALALWSGLGNNDLLALLARTVDPKRAFASPLPANLLMGSCLLAQIDQPTRDFITSARVALGAVRALNVDIPARGKLLSALDAAFQILDTREPLGETFYASVAPAYAVLRQGIAQAGAPLDVSVYATGHAHLDVAWLWTLDQTHLKARRTFHTVLRLMEEFPEYHFTQSQPQLYDYVRRDDPALFAAIQQRVAEGRWELTGGMWLEADCNVSGSESLARQFVLGRAFFARHFAPAVDTPVLWLPDVFGYAWALPQLIKQAGLEYFFTIKIGWNQYNRLPADSFWWQGLDGTRVLTHFSTTPDNGSAVSTYNAMATPEQTLGTWTNFRQKDLARGEQTPPLLMAFGFGDGGGGPTREMLENLREMQAFPSLPRVRQQNVGTFFRELEESFGETLPIWNAELYFELHRGTYTTQGRTKRANRTCEFLLHDAEYLAAQAALLTPAYAYPHETLRQAWELLCLNQFHDILPGSSIHEVYEQAAQDHGQIAQLAQEIRESALAHLAQSLDGDLLLVNPTSFIRTDLAFWPVHVPAGQQLLDVRSGEPVVAQASEGGTWLSVGPCVPFSVTALKLVPVETAQPLPLSELVVTPSLLENRYVRVELNEQGDIARIFDKTASREVLAPGVLANQWQAFEDRPKEWDAWDIDIFYDEKMWTAEPATSLRVVEQGPLRATIEIARQILHSRYTQRISLRQNSARLDITTHIDWQERHILLKAAFPVEILSPTATYEIQWGNVQRPTHRNTSWDWARFETCAQKWVDLSEGDYGVSLLNDCKYGHDIQNNVMRISLLRSPTSPDPQADQGEHTFTYSLLPHTGSWGEHTMGEAYALNDPLLVYQRGARDERGSEATAACLPPLVASEQPNIIIETLKQAEDGQGLIVRLYESQRRRGPITLSVGFPLQAAWLTNLLEQNEHELTVDSSRSHITLTVRPYQIVTLRLVPAR